LAKACVSVGNAQEVQQAVPLATPAGGQQYPGVDIRANEMVQKYRSASCDQIAAQRAAPPTERQARFVQVLRADRGMQQAFLNRVAAPIATKLFECSLIP